MTPGGVGGTHVVHEQTIQCSLVTPALRSGSQDHLQLGMQKEAIPGLHGTQLREEEKKLSRLILNS